MTWPILRHELRAWQVQAVEAWTAAQHRGVVNVTTGGGKTAFATACMAVARSQNTNARFAILTPTRALLDQWFVALTEDYAVPESEVSTYHSPKIEAIPEAHFHLMTLDSGRTLAPRIADAYPTMLVVDECHRAGTEANAKALAGKHLGTLGLSATPERPYDENFVNLVVPTLGEIIYDYTLAEAIRDGILCSFDMVNVHAPLTRPEMDLYGRLTKRIARLSRRALEADQPTDSLKKLLISRSRLSARAAMRVPVSIKILRQYRGQKCLVFHELVSDANSLHTQLKADGQSVTIYHSKISEGLRRDNLRLFRRGVYDVLVSCRALEEGINIPEAALALIVAASATNRQRIQRIGRVLRTSKGKESATVITLYSTEQEEKRLLEEANSLSPRSVSWIKATAARG